MPTDASPDRRSYRVSCDRLPRVVPDFRPRWNVAMGVAEVHDVLRGSDLAAADFEGARYSRIAHVRHLLDSGRIDSSLRWLQPALSAS